MRADVYVFEKGYAKSRAAAQVMISEKAVKINGIVIKKPSEYVDEALYNTVEITAVQKYVSRGGYKLEYALGKFSVNPKGMIGLDVGASTGGFTDCLLKHGASKVYAVDSGVGQLDKGLLLDDRVVNVEKYNARNMSKNDFVDPIEIAVMDVSFISQKLIIPQLSEVLQKGGIFVSLIKPQFEVGKGFIGKNGIVKDKKARLNAVRSVVEFAISYGFCLSGIEESSITGGDGNIEYVALFMKKEPSGVDYMTLINKLQR